MPLRQFISCNAGAIHRGHLPPDQPCPKSADTVAKVENRAAAKILRKSIFSRLRHCNAPQDRYDVCGRFCEMRCGPSRRRMKDAPAVLKNFVRQSKKTFSTLSAKSRHCECKSQRKAFKGGFASQPRRRSARRTKIRSAVFGTHTLCNGSYPLYLEFLSFADQSRPESRWFFF